MQGSTAPRRGLVLTTALILLVPGAALADSNAESQPRVQRSREILLQMEEPPQRDPRRWLDSHFHIHKRRGLEYSHATSVGERDVVFSLQGPAMPRKRLGLAFEVRF
jgi:hypothetical protein